METDDKVKQLRDRYIQTQTEILDAACEILESPIERAMWWGLANAAEWVNPRTQVTEAKRLHGLPGVDPAAGPVVALGLDRFGGFYEYDVLPQLRLAFDGKTYRLDFAVTCRALKRERPGESLEFATVFYALECDGHDFHERTKKQAEHDRARDRDLQALGWNVARFTGSEIYRDPLAAALKALEFGRSLIDRVR